MCWPRSSERPTDASDANDTTDIAVTMADAGAWRRSVRRRAPVSDREVGRRELGRRVEELEEAVEGLRGEKNAAETDEAALESSGAGGESGMNVMVIKKSVPPPPAEELEYTKDMGCAAATKAVAVEYTEEERVDGALELYARVEALEADRAATRRGVAALRAEPARVVLAREMARRLCRESAAVTMVQKPRFSVVAICKVLTY
ncbi:unnamed protein product [Triticum turgidum subsp. durum]|uniref:GTD-binding domain-containing protein n=1 Tax=Triticum turgidum subsp. durum TaxID=4567 RepID=A0A9R1NSY6_TRITD|nr:unnamed protein product [Triticum turgidum subsp. durum]